MPFLTLKSHLYNMISACTVQKYRSTTRMAVRRTGESINHACEWFWVSNSLSGSNFLTSQNDLCTWSSMCVKSGSGLYAWVQKFSRKPSAVAISHFRKMRLPVFLSDNSTISSYPRRPNFTTCLSISIVIPMCSSPLLRYQVAKGIPPQVQVQRSFMGFWECKAETVSEHYLVCSQFFFCLFCFLPNSSTCYTDLMITPRERSKVPCPPLSSAPRGPTLLCTFSPHVDAGTWKQHLVAIISKNFCRYLAQKQGKGSLSPVYGREDKWLQ